MSTSDLTTPVDGVEPTKGGLYLWRYLPNKGAAALFLVLFMASFVYICWKIFKTKAKYCIVFAVGCFLEMVGYGVRVSAHDKTGKLMPYVIQNFFILIAPAIFAASIYMVLGRIIIAVHAEKYSVIKPRKLTRTFVAGDVASFVIQGGASGMMVVQNASLAKWGERLVIVGLMVQVVMFGLFATIAVIFHRRITRLPTPASMDTSIPWGQALYMLYGVSVLIMIRSVFRVIEYAAGQTGYPLSHEWTLYIFDSLLMFIVTVWFGWRFPSDLKPKETYAL